MGTSCTATVRISGKFKLYSRTSHPKFQLISTAQQGPIEALTVEHACALHGSKWHCHGTKFREIQILFKDLSPKISANSVQNSGPHGGPLPVSRSQLWSGNK